jgi:hypothetical protein
MYHDRNIAKAKVIAKVRKRNPEPDKYVWILLCVLAIIYTIHGMGVLLDHDVFYR